MFPTKAVQTNPIMCTQHTVCMGNNVPLANIAQFTPDKRASFVTEYARTIEPVVQQQ